MQPSKIVLPPKQQSLAFAQDETWEHLSKETHEAVRSQLTQMLQAAVLRGRETNRSENEREDSH